MLQLSDLVVRYRSDAPAALKSISLTVEAGEHVAVIGLNGSGKSTLLAAVAGLTPFSGAVEIGGTRLTRKSVDALRRSLGFLFAIPEDQLLFPLVLDDVAFSLTQRGIQAPESVDRARAMLRALDIEDLALSSPYALSHGQRLRVALAGVLVTQPDLLLLDEPTSGLDPVGRRKLIPILRESPAAMLLATHDLQFAASVCSRFILLDEGRIVDSGTDFNRPAMSWETPFAQDDLQPDRP